MRCEVELYSLLWPNLWGSLEAPATAWWVEVKKDFAAARMSVFDIACWDVWEVCEGFR